MSRRQVLRAAALWFAATVAVFAAVAAQPDPQPSSTTVLQRTMVHFQPDSAAHYAQPGERSEDDGRAVVVVAQLPDSLPPGRILAHFTLHPTPKTDREMWDRWDRAGNLRLVTDGLPDLEIARFMTAYGGRTDHVVDVSELAPLLRGRRTFRAFVDTWVSPAWRVDFSLSFAPDTLYTPPAWAQPIFYTDSFNAQEHADGVTVPVTVPAGLARVVLRYFTTGHCTDGRDDDEFVSKANVIAVDGVVVARFHPWRDDCRRFRERNPYCARWTDGNWSSDYSRSGWCPGVEVLPHEFDLTDHLTPGPPHHHHRHRGHASSRCRGQFRLLARLGGAGGVGPITAAVAQLSSGAALRGKHRGDRCHRAADVVVAGAPVDDAHAHRATAPPGGAAEEGFPRGVHA